MLKIIGNLSFFYSLIVGGFIAFQRIQIAFKGGACPLPTQRPWLYSAIAAALLSIALSYIDDKNKKNDNIDDSKKTD